MGLSTLSLDRAKSAEAHYLRLTRLRAMSHADLRALLAGDPAKAAPWIESAARSGIAEAQVRLGRMLLEGQGMTRDPAAAARWFRAAADAGDAEAMNMVGRGNELGWGGPVDLAAAARWYRASAQAGHDWGEYNYANMLFDGRGVAADRPAALAWYRRASDQGHARAMNLLGRCLEEGWGVPRDAREAAIWYRRSAEAGYFRAQFNHAAMLLDHGAPSDAADWFVKAAESGDDAMRKAIVSRLARERHPDLVRVLRSVAALAP